MDYDRILQAIIDVGEEMIVCGAEVSRVEDSISRMCISYGAKADRVNVFIITSNIQVTLETSDGRILTQIRRIIRSDVNFDRLDYLNDLSRYICSKTPDQDVIHEKLEEVLNRKPPHPVLKFIGAILVAGGFTVFFGGSIMDGIGASIMGAVIIIIEAILASREKNLIVYNFIVSVVAGFTAIAVVYLGVGTHMDKIMIGGIMLLIPGIAMTNAIRDMLIGDIASGMLRLVNSVLIAAAIACGFAFCIIVTGGVI